MSEASRRTRFAAILWAVLLTASAMVAGVAGVAAAERTGEITSVTVDSTVDEDGDGYVSEFGLVVEADTTLEGWDGCVLGVCNDGEPTFVVQIDGEEVAREDVDRRANGRFELSLSDVDFESFDRSRTLPVTVVLVDRDLTGVDTVDRTTRYVEFEPPSDDRATSDVELAVSVDGGGGFSIDPPGASFGSDTTRTYATGETVRLTAQSAPGYEFDGWTGDVPADQRDDRSITLSMDADRSVSPKFVERTPEPTPTATRTATPEPTATPTPTTSDRSGDLSIERSRTDTVVGSPVYLRAHAEGDPESYHWTVESVPSGDDGPPATPHDQGAAVTAFRPEAAGEYELAVTTTYADGSESTAFTTVRVDPRPDVIDRYAPILHYHEDEEYRPTRYEAFFENALLVSTPNSLDDVTDEDDFNILVDEPTMFDVVGKGDQHLLLLKGDESTYPDYDDEYPVTVHASVHEDVQYDDEQYTAVVYWLFYVFDPKDDPGSLTRHVSDLERIVVLLDENDRPQWLAASQHYGGEIREWEKVERDGTHPLVYPAVGSHANFLRDTSTFDGNGMVGQEQFFEDSLRGTNEIPVAGGSERTGSDVVYGPDGAAGDSYEIVALDDDVHWSTFEGVLMGLNYRDIARQLLGKSGTVPQQTVLWDSPTEWLSIRPLPDEEQIRATLMDGDPLLLPDIDVGGDELTVTTEVENVGPKPHEFWVAVEAKPADASWSDGSVRAAEEPIRLGTGKDDRVSVSVPLPESATGDWHVRVRAWGYGESVREPEDLLAETGTAVVELEESGPTADLDAPDAIELGEDVVLDASGSSAPGGELTYEWDLLEAPAGFVTLPTGSEGVVTPSEPGTYTFEVTVSDGSAEDSATATVEVVEPATETPTPTPTPTEPPSSSETLLADDFEDQPVGSYPDGWQSSGSSSDRVVDQPVADGRRAFRLKGSPGGCWESLSHREVDLPEEGTVEITASVRPTSDGQEGCHATHAKIGFNVGSSWTTDGVNLLNFRTSGQIKGTGLDLGGYDLGRWYDLRIVYERSGGTVTLTYYVDGTYRGETTRSAKSSEDDMAYLTIASGDFTAYFDEISVERLDG